MNFLRRVLLEATFFIVIITGAVFTIFTVGPWAETKFLPVVSKLNIEKMERGEARGTTNVYASFSKLRACEYLGIAWYRGKVDANGFERVPLVLMRQKGDDSSPNRPVGYQRSGPWIVSIPMDEIKANSFVRLTHRCHLLWVTTTEFYP